MDLSKTPYLGGWRSWVWADLVGCNLLRAHLHLWLCQTTTVFWTDRSEDRQPSVMHEFYCKPRKVKSPISDLRMVADLFSNLLSPLVYHYFAHLCLPNCLQAKLGRPEIPESLFAGETGAFFCAGRGKERVLRGGDSAGKIL